MSRGIVVLDFGGQYAHLIANRVRRLNVWAQILPPDADVSLLQDAAGVILSGRLASASPLQASGYELDAIAAVVIGIGSVGDDVIAHGSGT